MEAVLLQAARDLDGATRVMEQQMREAHSAEANPLLLLRRVQAVRADVPALLARLQALSAEKDGLIAEIRDNLLASTAAADAAGDLTGVVPASPLPVARFTELVGGSLPEREVVPAAEPTQPSDEGADSDDDEAEQAAGDVVRARIRAKEQAAAATPAGGPPPSGRRRRRRSSTGSSRRRSTDSMVASFGEITEEEFKRVPSLTRGRAKLEDVRAAQAAIEAHFRPKSRAARRRSAGGTGAEPLSRSALEHMGVKCTGRTGEAVLNVLRSLGRIKLSNAGVTPAVL